MAIIFNETIGPDGKPKGILNVDNGDLQAIKNAMEQYNFVNQEALLRYALVALLNSSDNKLYVRNNGNIVSMKIAENLIKKPETNRE